LVKKKRSKKDIPADFEGALEALETLVEQMEAGEITLEESLEHFERGILLTRTCQEALKAAEQKVEILMKNSADASTQPFANTQSLASTQPLDSDRD